MGLGPSLIIYCMILIVCFLKMTNCNNLRNEQSTTITRNTMSCASTQTYDPHQRNTKREMNLRLYLTELEKTFMERAVCNHGFFMMAPNVWNPSTKSLTRPLRLSNSSSTIVTISHPYPLPFLVIQVHSINNVSPNDEQLILHQVARMLRISTKDQHDVREFQKLHEPAKKTGFGRIFRSPSLFEDIVKTVLLCNSTWDKTLGMASRLCLLQSKLADRTLGPHAFKKRKPNRIPDEERRGNFPSAKEIASLEKEFINEHCKLGYRAKYIIKIAKMVENGSLHLEEMEETDMGLEQVFKKLSSKGNGFGPFATATLLMCTSLYHLVPCDTETKRLLREVHKLEICSEEKIEKVEKVAQQYYERFSPFQSLAYWFDLIQNYETKVGKLSELNQCDYYTVGGCSHIKKSKENYDQRAEAAAGTDLGIVIRVFASGSGTSLASGSGKTTTTVSPLNPNAGVPLFAKDVSFYFLCYYGRNSHIKENMPSELSIASDFALFGSSAWTHVGHENGFCCVDLCVHHLQFFKDRSVYN